MAKGVGRRSLAALALAAPFVARTGRARAGKKYDPGVSDTEIKLGTTSPYSGPASSFGAYGVAQVAYFAMINDTGGINGRKIDLISLDDSYSPPKTIEQTRRLVESDGVLAIAGGLGTAPNSAVQKYLNSAKVPQLFLTSGGMRFNNPTVFPWSIPLYPSYHSVGRVFGKNLLRTAPDTKIAILFMNDDLGRDYVGGLRAELGARADSMIVETQSHEITDAVVDAQIVKMSESRAETVFLITTPKFAAQAIRKMADMGWYPQRYLAPNAASIEATIKPAGVEKSVGLMTAAWEKRADDPTWASDADMIAYLAFLKKYAPSATPANETLIPGYINAYMIAHVLRACGDELTRAEILKQAISLADVAAPMLLPGIKLSNSPTDYTAFHQLKLARFDGTRWVRVGELIDLSDIGSKAAER